MRVAIDARELCGKRTGVGTYLAALLGQWDYMPEAREHEWRLYVPEPGPPAGVRAANATWRTVPGPATTWWEQRALPRALAEDRPDVLFAPGYTAPLVSRVPCVLTVHDVSFFAHPEWFGRREGWRRRFLTRLSARRARSVLTDSEFSRREIVRFTGAQPSRVRVIYPGVSAAEQAAPNARDRQPRPPVVLYVGSIFNRRRVPDLIRAFAAAAGSAPAAMLEIVGDNRTHPREDLSALAASLGVGSRVRVRAYVDDDTLQALYEHASVFAFLSEYEGFGFTPLEALSHGVPAVVLDTPVAREIYDDAAMYVGSGDIVGTAVALTRLLSDSAARATLLDAGARLLPRYSWTTAARETLGALEAAR
ncbi:MAG: glycosyltransferase family 4 protein [Bacteroidales bacterium]